MANILPIIRSYTVAYILGIILIFFAGFILDFIFTLDGGYVTAFPILCPMIASRYAGEVYWRQYNEIPNYLSVFTVAGYTLPATLILDGLLYWFWQPIIPEDWLFLEAGTSLGTLLNVGGIIVLLHVLMFIFFFRFSAKDRARRMKSGS